MNTAKMSDWLQIAAAVGVIIGLVLVAYELRQSNRIAWEQASADALERWDRVAEFEFQSETAELLLRVHAGEELSREETIKLNAYYDVALNTILHEYRLYKTRTLDLPQGFEHAYNRLIQFYLGSQHGRRRWEVMKNEWQPEFVGVIDRALASHNQRNLIGELDYIRGASDRLD